MRVTEVPLRSRHFPGIGNEKESQVIGTPVLASRRGMTYAVKDFPSRSKLLVPTWERRIRGRVLYNQDKNQDCGCNTVQGRVEHSRGPREKMRWFWICSCPWMRPSDGTSWQLVLVDYVCVTLEQQCSPSKPAKNAPSHPVACKAGV